MRAKKPFLIALFLCAWSLISYFLLIRQTDTGQQDATQHGSHKFGDSRRKRGDILKQLNRLELNIQEENELHDQLVKKLVEIVRIKEGGLDGDSNNNNNDAKRLNVPVAARAAEGAAAAAVANGANVDSKQKNSINSPIDNNAIDNVIFYDSKDDSNNNNNNNNNDNNKNENSLDVIESTNSMNEIEAEAESQLDEAAQLDAHLRKLNKKSDKFKGPIIPVLVFACNRISVRNCLDDLVRYRPNAQQFPIIVSQDCNDEPTKNVIESFKEVTYMRQPDQSDIFVLPKEKKFKGYYKISRHYGWALNTTFKAGFEYVIIVEDDLNVSPDFYEYFLGTHELLKNDSSLWCVSAWNDNGKESNIDLTSPELLYRTDFFPGLGWMLTKDLWNELSVKWPKAFWDDWIRQPQQRKDRACIRPEISRTRTFGKIGVSNGLFFDKHLRYIKLNDKVIEFTKMNLTHLLKWNYDKQFIDHVYSCPIVTFEEIRRGLVSTKEPVRIQYNTKDQYKRTAKLLGLMDDFKSGVPRTGYHGIVSFYYNHQRVYLAPNNNWKGYDLTWS